MQEDIATFTQTTQDAVKYLWIK